MTAIAILSLLGLTLFLPVLMNDDDTTDEPVDPAEPDEPVDLLDPLDPVEPLEPTDAINGTAGADTLVTTSAAQIVNGYAGADTLTAGSTSNAAVLYGGRDFDTLIVEGDSATAYGGRGDDIFEATGTNSFLSGNTGNDTFSLDGSNMTVNGDAGDDSIVSAEDNSGALISGGLGDDDIMAAGTNITINGDEGNDNIAYSAASGEVYGNIGDDTIIATSSDSGLSGSLFGNGGDDVLSAYDSHEAHGGVLLNGGDHDDIITTSANMSLRTVDGEQDTLTGGRHDDAFNIDLQFPDGDIPEGRIDIATITDFNRGDNILNIYSDATDASGVAFDGLELNVAEDGSYTEVIARYNSLTEGVDPTLAVIRLEGVDNLELGEINLTTGDVTTSGDDYISSGGGLGDAVATIAGGAGDDLLIHEGRDDAGHLVMEGGEGNDTLIAGEVEFSNATTLDGGLGDDLLVTQLFNSATLGSVDTFITGAGADTIEISSVWDEVTGDNDFGITARVTDFTPGEDMIVIDTAPISNGSAGNVTQSVTLAENTEGDYTDVHFIVTNSENASTFSGFVRLEGLTGLSEDDIGVALSDSADPPSAMPAYLYTETSEVRA